jgi:ABC-2 type transport system permease protein
LLFGASQGGQRISYGLPTLFVLMEIFWEQQQIPEALNSLSPFSWNYAAESRPANGHAAEAVYCDNLTDRNGIALFRRKRRGAVISETLQRMNDGID